MVKYYLNKSVVREQFIELSEKKTDEQNPAYRFSLFMASDNPTDFSLEELLDFYYNCPDYSSQYMHLEFVELSKKLKKADPTISRQVWF